MTEGARALEVYQLARRSRLGSSTSPMQESPSGQTRSKWGSTSGKRCSTMKVQPSEQPRGAVKRPSCLGISLAEEREDTHIGQRHSGIRAGF